MNIPTALQTVEQGLVDPHERSYFLIHSVRYQKVLEVIERISNTNTSTILDVGCYPYHMGKALELLGHTVYGISSGHEPIKAKHITTLNIETDKFPYKNSYFDLVLCSEVLEHLPQSPVPALEEMYRVTKSGGHLVTTVPNIARSINRGKLLAGKSVLYPIDMLLENNGKGNLLYHRHNHEYTQKELATVVTAAGWKIDQAGSFISYTPFRRRERPDPWWLWLGKFVNYVLMEILPSTKDTLVCVARK